MLEDKPDVGFLREAEAIYFHYGQLNVLRDKFTGSLLPSEVFAILDAYDYDYDSKILIFESIVFIEELRNAHTSSGNREPKS